MSSQANMLKINITDDIFYSGGMSWGGGGVKYINGVADKNEWERPVESVEVKGAPYRLEDVERLIISARLLVKQ